MSDGLTRERAEEIAKTRYHAETTTGWHEIQRLARALLAAWDERDEAREATGRAEATVHALRKVKNIHLLARAETAEREVERLKAEISKRSPTTCLLDAEREAREMREALEKIAGLVERNARPIEEFVDRHADLSRDRFILNRAWRSVRCTGGIARAALAAAPAEEPEPKCATCGGTGGVVVWACPDGCCRDGEPCPDCAPRHGSSDPA